MSSTDLLERPVGGGLRAVAVGAPSGGAAFSEGASSVATDAGMLGQAACMDLSRASLEVANGKFQATIRQSQWQRYADEYFHNHGAIPRTRRWARSTLSSSWRSWRAGQQARLVVDTGF